MKKWKREKKEREGGIEEGKKESVGLVVAECRDWKSGKDDAKTSDSEVRKNGIKQLEVPFSSLK